MICATVLIRTPTSAPPYRKRIGTLIVVAYSTLGYCVLYPAIALVPYGWVGHVYAQKRKGPGTKGFAFIHFLPSGFGGAFYTKRTRRPRQVPGQFPNRLEVNKKDVSDWLYK